MTIFLQPMARTLLRRDRLQQSLHVHRHPQPPTEILKRPLIREVHAQHQNAPSLLVLLVENADTPNRWTLTFVIADMSVSRRSNGTFRSGRGMDSVARVSTSL